MELTRFWSFSHYTFVFGEKKTKSLLTLVTIYGQPGSSSDHFWPTWLHDWLELKAQKGITEGVKNRTPHPKMKHDKGYVQ